MEKRSRRRALNANALDLVVGGISLHVFDAHFGSSQHSHPHAGLDGATLANALVHPPPVAQVAPGPTPVATTVPVHGATAPGLVALGTAAIGVDPMTASLLNSLLHPAPSPVASANNMLSMLSMLRGLMPSGQGGGNFGGGNFGGGGFGQGHRGGGNRGGERSAGNFRQATRSSDRHYEHADGGYASAGHARVARESSPQAHVPAATNHSREQPTSFESASRIDPHTDTSEPRFNSPTETIPLPRARPADLDGGSRTEQFTPRVMFPNGVPGTEEWLKGGTWDGQEQLKLDGGNQSPRAEQFTPRVMFPNGIPGTEEWSKGGTWDGQEQLKLDTGNDNGTTTHLVADSGNLTFTGNPSSPNGAVDNPMPIENYEAPAATTAPVAAPANETAPAREPAAEPVTTEEATTTTNDIDE